MKKTKMMKRNLFLFHMLVGTIILILAFNTTEVFLGKVLLFIIAVFFATALFNHFRELEDYEQKEIEIEYFKILVGVFISAAITWYVNHHWGLGPIIANGLIGLIASILFPKEAGAYYVASFIGMSSQVVVPSMLIAGIIGIITGFAIIFSKEVYEGVGGKGGTIAVFSTQIVRVIMNLFA